MSCIMHLITYIRTFLDGSNLNAPASGYDLLSKERCAMIVAYCLNSCSKCKIYSGHLCVCGWVCEGVCVCVGKRACVWVCACLRAGVCAPCPFCVLAEHTASS